MAPCHAAWYRVTLRRGSPSHALACVVVLAVAVCLVAGCAALALPGQSGKGKVLMPVEENSADMNFMLTNELGVMSDMLKKAGYTVVTASQSGQTLGAGSAALKPDLKIADVKAGDYVGVIS